MTLFHGFHAIKSILLMLVGYNLACVMIFSFLYSAIGFKANFNLPDGMPDSYPNRLYYSFATQATCMAGEIYPTTYLGRGVLSFQILSAWLVTLALVVPWIRTGW